MQQSLRTSDETTDLCDDVGVRFRVEQQAHVLDGAAPARLQQRRILVLPHISHHEEQSKRVAAPRVVVHVHVAAASVEKQRQRRAELGVVVHCQVQAVFATL